MIIDVLLLCFRIYHPDKHVEEDKKRQAELMFAKLKSAYEVHALWLARGLRSHIFTQVVG